VPFFAKAIRDVIGILSVVFNQQDLQAAALFLASARPFDGARDGPRDYTR
jgi:hypothetical protein